jgi:FG-GAP repeat/FG-GAP-like repeat
MVAAQTTAPSCSVPGQGWCLARRISGDVPEGELGFRFGEPLDMDGDGRADIAAGTRFKPQGIHQNGSATVWSGATGARIREWDADRPDGLFGHWVLPIPDLGTDGLADVIITAPNTAIDGTVRGLVLARSPKSGEQLWQRAGNLDENLGWDVTLAGDHDGDGRVDLFVGAPAGVAGHAYLLSGRDGARLRTYAPPTDEPSFGWYVARLDDLDGDGRPEIAVGAPAEKDADRGYVGEAYVFSSATGEMRQHWHGPDDRSRFGDVVASVADIDGDGRGDVAVAAPRTDDHTRSRPGEVFIYSSATGKELRHWSGSQPGELFGRMVASAGDLDGDGVEDLAIAAPWFRRDAADRTGRVEFRSGRSGAVFGELSGDAADAWFGWHIRRAPDPDGLGRPALLISALREPVGGHSGVGVLDLYVWRRPPAADQGTTTRGARVSDIK